MNGMLAAQVIDLNVTHLPAMLQPGKSAQISLAFERDGGVVEKRLVFLVELRRTEDDSVFRTMTFDNAGKGYTASSGSMSFVASIPNDTEAIYFNAYASPWSLNRWVVEQFRSYPTNGTYTYSWVGNSFGVMNDVYYRGSLIAPKPGNNTTYCSGAAFEVGVFAALNYNALHGHETIGGMSVAQMQSFRRVWYGTLSDDPDPQLKLAALAIPKFGIGREITDWDEVQEGDFLQFWRTSGSGHNPIFVSWLTNASGTRTGIRYWGSQGNTNGLGYRNESFSGLGGSIDPARTFFGRLAKPRDRGDIDFALKTMSTVDNPTILVPPPVKLNGWAVY
jgi:hypothetical protein